MKLKKSSIFICILFTLNFWSCKESSTNIELPPLKEVRLPTNIYQTATNGTTYNTNGSNSALPKFNISDYQNIESIIFEAEISSTDSNYYCFVDLFDVTDSISIVGSEMKNNSNIYLKKKVFTGNIKDAFPRKEIKLVARIRSEIMGNFVDLNESVLIISHR